METKFDILQQNMTEKIRRESNIKTLSKELQEAKEVLRAIPNSTDFETLQDRKIVNKRIRELSELLDDEKKAVCELNGTTFRL